MAYTLNTLCIPWKGWLHVDRVFILTVNELQSELQIVNVDIGGRISNMYTSMLLRETDRMLKHRYNID